VPEAFAHLPARLTSPRAGDDWTDNELAAPSSAFF
jgi:hypothetical protein